MLGTNDTKDVFQPNRNGEIPLYVACKYGLVRVVKNLIRIDTSSNHLNYSNVNACCPIHIACYNGYNDIVKLLLSAGVCPNSEINRGIVRTTPLIAACYNGHVKVVKTLIDAGADIEVVNEYGKTPLNIACCYGYTKVVKILLDAGADIEKANMYSACAHGYTEIVKLLLSYGYDVNSNSYLLLASLGNHTDIVRMLIFEGVNTDCLDKNYKFIVQEYTKYKQSIRQEIETQLKSHVPHIVDLCLKYAFKD